MKIYNILASAFFAVALCSCQYKSDVRPVLSKAENLMESHPDNARRLLLSIKNKIGGESRSVRMNYALLMTEADDKCYITHTSDSLMLKAVDYYGHNGTPYDRMEAYYLMGRVYSDMQFLGSAIEYFKKAADTKCNDNNRTYILRARANDWIGQTYMYQETYNKALPFFNETYHYALLAKNESIIVYALRDIGRSYVYQKKNNMGIAAFERAASEAKKSGQESLYRLVLAELAKYYTNNKEYNKAKQALCLACGFSAPLDLSVYCVNYADLYKATGKLDSAIYYYNKCLSIKGEIDDRRNAARNLCAIYLMKGENTKAIKYAKMSWNITKCVEKMTLATNNDLISSLNKKIRIEEENTKLQNEKSEQLILLILLVCLFVTALIYIINRSRNKRMLYKEHEMKLKGMLSTLQLNSEKTIEDNSLQIQKLTEQLSLSEQQKNKLQNDLLKAEKQVLLKRNEQIKAERIQQELLIKKLENTEIYQSFHSFNFNPDAQDFVELKNMVNETYDRFTFRIKEVCPPINTKELQICCMIKIGMRTKEIKNIYNSTSESISMCKLRLYRKIFNKNGTTEDFDDFIRKL
jgi:hypothetical protein